MDRPSTTKYEWLLVPRCCCARPWNQPCMNRSNLWIEVSSIARETNQTVMALNEDLANEEWNDIFGEKDVNKTYEIFINKLTYYYDKNIPLVKSKQHNSKIKNPWITRGTYYVQ